MALINIHAQESTEVTYEPGNYEALIQGASMELTRNTKQQMLVVVLKGEFGGARTITARLLDNGYGQRQLFQLAQSVGLDPKGALDTDDFVGKYVGITIEEGEPYNDKPSWNVTKFFALDDPDTSDEGVEEISEEDWSDAE